MAQTVKHLPAMPETQVRSLGQENPLEKEMATYSSILAWEMPWTEEPGGPQSMESQRVRHDWATSLPNLRKKVSLRTLASGESAWRKRMAEKHKDDGDERPEESTAGRVRLLERALARLLESICQQLKKSRRDEQRGVWAIKHTPSPRGNAECSL